LRDIHIAFHNSCTNLHSHPQCRRFPFSPHPCQNLLLFVLLMMAILTGVRRNLDIVLVCISFVAKEVQHFFICLLVTCTSSLENCLFSSFAHLFSWLLILGEVSFLGSLSILVILVRYIAGKDFLPFCRLSLFELLRRSFLV
jgi:hypothetical protein